MTSDPPCLQHCSKEEPEEEILAGRPLAFPALVREGWGDAGAVTVLLATCQSRTVLPRRHHLVKPPQRILRWNLSVVCLPMLCVVA